MQKKSRTDVCFSNNLLPVDPCLQNFTTEVTLPEHQLGLPSAAPGQYKAREGQDWVVKYLQLVHDTWNEVVKVIIINGVQEFILAVLSDISNDVMKCTLL